ncbi:MAG TPA: phage tail tape measure protein [Polyangiaceae bacterium]|nr:phage tail tape measure protein [Polyangiaceae bacterium]
MANMGAKTTRFERTLGGANKVADRGAGLITGFGAATAVAGSAAAMGFHTLVGASDAVDDSLAKFSSIVSDKGEVSRARESALAWSKAHRDTAVNFLDTSYMMASAGLQGEAAIEGTRAALQVATATMGDGVTAGGLIATLYNNVADKAANAKTEIERLGDVVTKTQQTFQFANLGQLNEGLKYGIPSALQFGIEIEELSAVIGVLNNKGLQGSMAGTAFGASMRSMQKASKALRFDIAQTAAGGVDFTGTVQNIEKRFGRLGDMTDETKQKFALAFGDEGWRGLSLLLANTDDLSKGLAQVKDNAGATARAAAEIESKGSARWTILGNRITALKVGLGDALAPAAEKALGAFGRLVGIGDEWLSTNQALLSQKLGEKITEWTPIVESFGKGMKDAFNDAKPTIEAVGSALSGVFGEGAGGARTQAYELGNNIATAAVRFGEFWLVTKAVTAATAVWSFVAGAARTAMIALEGIVWAAKTAWFWYNVWTKAGTASTIAMAGAGVIAQGSLMATRVSAFAAAGGFKALAGAAGLATVAYLAYAAVQEQNDALKKETGGKGILDVGWEWATTDKGLKEIADENLDRQAKEEARAAGRLPGVTGATAQSDLSKLSSLAALGNIDALTRQLEALDKASGQLPPGMSQTPVEAAGSGSAGLAGLGMPVAAPVSNDPAVVSLKEDSSARLSQDLSNAVKGAVKGAIVIKLKDPGKTVSGIDTEGSDIMSIDPSGSF